MTQPALASSMSPKHENSMSKAQALPCLARKVELNVCICHLLKKEAHIVLKTRLPFSSHSSRLTPRNLAKLISCVVVQKERVVETGI
jgi:hypothetical protein